MYTIDQRILVKTPAPSLWNFISNFENNLKWHHDCTAISFLSQKRQGMGTRWRQTTNNRLEMVFEILTWYDGLGFEYKFVDGHRYKTCIGRVRLQEIAEGTLLQWTLQYELKGVLGGVQNRLGMNSTIQNEMYVSLKNLAKLGNTIGSLENYAPKSLMKDGSTLTEERIGLPDIEPQSPVAIPPPSITTSFALEPVLTVEDTQPSRPMQLQDVPPPITYESKPVFSTSQTLDPRKDTAELVKVIPSSSTVMDDATFITGTTLPSVASLSVPSVSKDPNQMSIWEIFGIPNPNGSESSVPKPSYPTPPVVLSPINMTQRNDEKAGTVYDSHEERVGLRKIERIKLAKVRIATKKPL